MPTSVNHSYYGIKHFNCFFSFSVIKLYQNFRKKSRKNFRYIMLNKKDTVKKNGLTPFLDVFLESQKYRLFYTYF